MGGKTVKAALLIGLTIVWGVGSWWWYRCGIKGFCATDASSAVSPVGTSGDDQAGALPGLASPMARKAVEAQAPSHLEQAVPSPMAAPRPVEERVEQRADETSSESPAVDAGSMVAAPASTVTRESAVGETSVPVSSPSQQVTLPPQSEGQTPEAPVALDSGEPPPPHSSMPSSAATVATKDGSAVRAEPPRQAAVQAQGLRMPEVAPRSTSRRSATAERSSFIVGDRGFAVVAPEAPPSGAIPQRVYLYFERTVSGLVPAGVDDYLQAVARLVTLGGKRVSLVVPTASQWDFGPAAFANERRARYVRILLHRRGVPLSAMEIHSRAMALGPDVGRAGFSTEPIELIVHD